MCRYISFFVDLRTAEVRVFDLDSHNSTEERLFPAGLNVYSSWVEGHYLPDTGCVFCSSKSIGEASTCMWAEKEIKNRWPTFAAFESWALDQLEAMCTSHDEGVDAALASLLRHRQMPPEHPFLQRRINQSDLIWTTGAHIAAAAGRLSPEFKPWSLKDCYGIPVIFEYLRCGNPVPPGFRAWNMCLGISRIPLAHECAHEGLLPSDFNQWRLKDKAGDTVAHVAARKHRCGPGGTTVAWNIPKDMWGLKNENGDTVLALYLRQVLGQIIPGNAYETYASLTEDGIRDLAMCVFGDRRNERP